MPYDLYYRQGRIVKYDTSYDGLCVISILLYITYFALQKQIPIGGAFVELFIP